MAKTSFIDFKAVKAALTMEGVLRHYNLLDNFKRTGDDLSGPCPIHKGTNPTQFRVSTAKNIWNCFSECKNGGNVLDFIAQMEDVSIHAAALNAIEWFGLDAKQFMQSSSRKKSANEESTEEEAPKEEAPPKKPEKLEPNKPLKFRLEKLLPDHPFLRERGLKPETVEAFGAGYCAKGMMADRIAIPIGNAQGEVVGYVGRFPGEPSGDQAKYKLPPGFRKSLELFNIERAIKEPAENPLVVVEGFFDCMSLHQNGCRKSVALMGTSLSKEQEELILKLTNRQSRIIVMLDEDEAGRAGREEIAGRLAKFAYVTIHSFEKEGQQPSDLTAEDVQNLLAHG